MKCEDCMWKRGWRDTECAHPSVAKYMDDYNGGYRLLYAPKTSHMRSEIGACGDGKLFETKRDLIGLLKYLLSQ